MLSRLSFALSLLDAFVVPQVDHFLALRNANLFCPNRPDSNHNFVYTLCSIFSVQFCGLLKYQDTGVFISNLLARRHLAGFRLHYNNGVSIKRSVIQIYKKSVGGDLGSCVIRSLEQNRIVN